GAESMSMVPIVGNKPSANPWLMEHHPESYLSMGLTAERVAEKYGISREAADAFALASHQKAVAAQDAGRFAAEIVPVRTRVADPAAADYWREVTINQDEGPRRNTSLAALAALKPVFHAHGRVTAGNSSQTSDGAAAALIASEPFVRERKLKPIARLAGYATAGVDPALMGMGPVEAIPRALRRAGIKLEEIALIELNEAFAAQALAVIAAAHLDPERVNVNGGAIALGHPLGCTGAKLLATLLHELQRRKARWGLVTMCVGGGQGAAAVIENLAV
ncbi:MAG: thiolase family protein, partial [Streptosporangiaceae bacterium]